MANHLAGFDFLNAQWLVTELRKLQARTDWAAIEPECDGDVPTLDVRLQVVDGDAILRSGDAQFDSDARGYWGASCITEFESADELLDTARDLISQAADMAAEDHADAIASQS